MSYVQQRNRQHRENNVRSVEQTGLQQLRVVLDSRTFSLA